MVKCLLSPPFLSLSKIYSTSKTRTASAVLRMLSRSSPNPNPNPQFLRSIRTTAEKTLAQPLPHFTNPSPCALKPHLLHAKAPNLAIRAMGAPSRSSAVAISGAEELSSDPPPALVVVSFYRFGDFPDHGEMRKPLKELCEEVVQMNEHLPFCLRENTSLPGGIILAPEGINGSICGTRESVDKVLNFIQADERLKGLRQVESPVTPEDEAIHHGHTSHSPLGAGEDAPFRWDHVRVKLKKEIVTFGDPGVMPTKMVGEYVKPRDWNALISDPDTMVIDVRNTYETRIGKFKRAVDPCTTAFREFPYWVDELFKLTEFENQPSQPDGDSMNDSTKEKNHDGESRRLPRVAMYCTGGIRCEKASSFLLSKGFKEVYHLEGGILKYLEEVPKMESLWEGECFVFDKRVSVEHGLDQGTYKLCYGCKQPVSDEDMESPQWEYGVTCPYCFSTKSEEEKERARARQRQFQTWGVIGGPDKGRRNPATSESKNDRRESKHLPNSV